MTENRAPHIVVIGGGLAGLSGAIACVDAGARVSLFEAKPRLGGATWSFERRGLQFDNGQHVYLRCCNAYLDFLDRIGSKSDAPLQNSLAIPVLRPRAGAMPSVAWIKRNRLPAPAQLGGSLLRYRHLSFMERMQVGRAVLALRQLDLSDPRLDDETFSGFLTRHHQSSNSIATLWNLIALPTTNVSSDEVSLTLAAKVFQTGLLTETNAADLGWSQVPLGLLHGDRAAAVLQQAGARVERSAKVQAIKRGATSTSGVGCVTVDGTDVAADGVILAVPHEAASELLPRGSTVDLGGLKNLGVSPIIDVHLVFDQKVMDYDIAAAIDSPVQYVFDRSRAAGMPEGQGQCLAISISGADAEHGDRPEVLIERYTAAITELFPRARGARLIDAVVSREHEATFRGVPGTAKLRPGTDIGFSNLFLAGAWTDTGWPATMEGAVRSGVAAASRVLEYVGGDQLTSAKAVA